MRRPRLRRRPSIRQHFDRAGGDIALEIVPDEIALEIVPGSTHTDAFLRHVDDAADGFDAFVRGDERGRDRRLERFLRS